MENITTTATTILAVVGGLLVLMNFVDKIASWVKPSKDKDKSIDQRLAEHERMLTADKKRIDGIENGTNILIKANLALINHEITGNGIENLKKTRDSLQDYLIDR